MGAKLAGATTIIAVDTDPRKLEWATAFGATHTVNAADADAVARIRELTGGNGVNVSPDLVVWRLPADARPSDSRRLVRAWTA